MILDDRLWFPDPESAVSAGDLAGLVALGGDLSMPRLLLAYQRGIFPWTTNPVTWWSPNPRAIFGFGQFHISRSFKRVLKQQEQEQTARFKLTIDQAFREVMQGCAAPGGGERRTTWISPDFIEAYGELYRNGYAHSVECWHQTRLVGGIYGVAIGGFFAAESMFHTVSEASKIALFFLLKELGWSGFSLFDIQMLTPHTRSLGAFTIGRSVYLQRLKQALARTCPFPTSFSAV